ncbi:hypothetical protein ACFOY2_15225 [Nonomuraea purpurea]|uniref:Recombinase zinc beta ribbon domain-containing protein n=1 Tax=Nonomuraea purpurea TaxID=1849276 RepID=A0ABV8G3J5_9ACTN
MTADVGLTIDDAISTMRNFRRTELDVAPESGIPDESDSPYIGEGFLRCARCEGAVVVDSQDVGWYTTSRFYRCPAPGCGRRAPVSEVDAELESLTRQYLAEPTVGEAWRAERLAKMDHWIAVGRTVLPWCCDQRRRRELSRRLGKRQRMYVNAPKEQLFWFGTTLAGLIIDRVLTAGNSMKGRSLAELHSADREWISCYRSLEPWRRRELRRAVGGRGQLKKIDDEWEWLQNRVLGLLQETDWFYSGPPSRLPTEQRTMNEPWSQSPGVMGRERRALMMWALGARGSAVRLVVALDAAPQKRVQVVPAGETT